MANFKKGSAAAKAFMAKLRAARGKTKVVKAKAKAKKVVAKKTATKKVGNSYYGSGKIISAYNLKINTIYEWILGAEYLEVIYIGLTTKNKKIRAGSKMGIGGYLFKFVKDNTFVDLSYKAVAEAIRTIPKKVGAVKKVMPAKNASSMHKDTKSHNVNIRVVSGIDKNTQRLEYGQIYDTYLQLYLVKFANLSFSLWAVTGEGLTKALKHPEGKNQAPIVYRVKSYGIPKFEKMTIKELKDFK